MSLVDQSRIHFVENDQRPSSTLCDRICLVPYSAALEERRGEVSINPFLSMRQKLQDAGTESPTNK